ALGVAFSLGVWNAIGLLTTAGSDSFVAPSLAWVMCFGGAVAFLAPWRRDEITRAGIGLALLGGAHAAALIVCDLDLLIGGVVIVALLGTWLAVQARGRWSAVPAAIGALSLVVTMAGTWRVWWSPSVVREA